MPVVNTTLRRPDGTLITSARVEVRLFVGSVQSPAYDPSNDSELLAYSPVTPDATTGLVSITLPANADLEPANTYYQAAIHVPGQALTYETFVVPDGAGPYWLTDILVTPPAAGASIHETALDPHPQYATDTDLSTHVAAANPHPNYATDTDLAAHAADADPHPVYQTAAESAAQVAAHEADTTSVHGIPDTGVLETQSGAQTKASAAQAAAITAAATDATTKANAAQAAAISAAATDATTKVGAHEADTTAIHGITDTAALQRAARFLYLPHGWNDGWIAAKAAAAGATGTADVLFLGDSITQGCSPCTDAYTASWVGRIRAALNPVADFAYVVDSADYATTHVAMSGSHPFVISSTNRTWFSGYGLGFTPQYSTTAVADQVVYTSPYACTDLDIIYWDDTSGSWVYSLDGGADVTVSPTGALSIRKIQITGLSSGIHTLSFGKQSATTKMFIQGVTAYKTNAARTAGIRVARLGVGGMRGTSWNQSTRPTDPVLQIQGKATGFATTGFGFPMQPNLLIYAYGVNDCQSTTVGVATFRETVARTVEAAKRGQANASIMLIAPNAPSGRSSDSASAITNSTSWPLYVDALRVIAERYEVAFFDLHAKWGQLAVTNGFINSGNVHPTDAGHTDIANTLSALL